MTRLEIVEKLDESIEPIGELATTWAEPDEACLNAGTNMLHQALDMAKLIADEVPDLEQLPEYLKESTEFITAMKAFVEELRKE